MANSASQLRWWQRRPLLVLSIRSKGALAFTALFLYSLLVAGFAFQQKRELLSDFDAIEQLLNSEAMLREADLATFHAVMEMYADAEQALDGSEVVRFGVHYQALQERQLMLQRQLPSAHIDLADVDLAWQQLQREPGRAQMRQMVAALVVVKNALAEETSKVQLARDQASARYRRQADSVALTTFALGMLGLSLLGALVGLFFRRLTDDLRLLQQRAIEIVHGYRGTPLAVTRHDEVGALMTAVNSMAETLDQHEKEALLKRQKYFHQEKMAALGGLAAGVAHEIGNPIAAISGIAQEMVARQQSVPSEQSCGAHNCFNCHPELIYTHTERLSAITREIANLASPRPAVAEYLDLNSQIRSTCSLIRYDQRLQQVQLELDLDSQLPAVYGVADQLTQVIMNLMINAADALGQQSQRTPKLTIRTHATAQQIMLTVEDNGCGMTPAVRARALEPFFTTKGEGKGTGLGLSICHTIVQQHGGTLGIHSDPGMGTLIQIGLPIRLDEMNEDILS